MTEYIYLVTGWLCEKCNKVTLTPPAGCRQCGEEGTPIYTRHDILEFKQGGQHGVAYRGPGPLCNYCHSREGEQDRELGVICRHCYPHINRTFYASARKFQSALRDLGAAIKKALTK